jgi:MerR family transcriptional regulator, heat shock protein HspR
VGAYSGRDGAYSGRDLVRQQPPSTALVVWRPRRGADR